MQRLLIMAVLTILARQVGAALPAMQPFPVRVTANGFAALTVDVDTARVTGLWPHLYAHADATQSTPNLLYDAYFGVKVGDAKAVWATSLPLAPTADNFGLVEATGIVHDQRSQDGVVLTTLTFAPMTLPLPGAVMLAQATNTTAQPVTVTLAAIGNCHLGSGETADGESIHVLGGDGLVEQDAQTPHRMLYRAIGDQPSGLEATNPYNKWLTGLLFSADASSVGSDRVAGMQWPTVTLQPGETVTRGWLLLYGNNADDAQFAATSDLWLAGRTPLQVLADEQAEWQAWHALDKLPPGLDAQSQLQLQRNLATLRMAQVREPDAGQPGQNLSPYGQIIASLPPGIWHIAWVRDQAYAGVALAASGHVAEAKAALEFVQHGQVGAYQSYFGGPYLVSPVRYFGGGLEESDADANGPNIEFDGLGLYLWQAARYVAASNDAAWLTQRWPQMRDLVAERLLALRDPTGLLQKDSSIWEAHWNGKQKHFAYSDILAVRGLCGAADLADLAGQTKIGADYRSAALAMRDAIVGAFVGSDHVLRGNLEESPAAALDIAAVEAFLDGQIDPGGQTALATWQAWQQKLSAGGGPGLIRNDDGGLYDSAEWLFIDLRVLRMLERMQAAGQNVDPGPLHARMQEVIVAGGGVVPELIGTQSKDPGQFAGAIPMVGFGAGVMALWLGGEAWGDDLSACLAKPTVADDTQVVEPETDSGSTSLDAEFGESDGADAAEVTDADDATPTVADASDAAAGTDASATDAQPTEIFADSMQKAETAEDVAPPEAAASRASGCQASGAAADAGIALALACALIVRRRATSKGLCSSDRGLSRE
jgi:GH15 family glucan-1,4-alpha-glucosidase